MDTVKQNLAIHTYPHSQRKNGRHFLSWLLFFMLAEAFCLLLEYIPGVDEVSALYNSMDSMLLRYLLSLLFMMICAITPMPAELVVLVNGAIYTPIEAFLISWLSAMIGALLGYELGRLNSIKPAFIPINNKYRNICHRIAAGKYVTLLVMRIIPIVPFFVLNIVSGAFKLARYKYTAITAISIIPAIAILTWLPSLFI